MEIRIVLIRNLEEDTVIPQQFQVRTNETVESLLTKWANQNSLPVLDFAFFSHDGRNIENCRLISDLPLLAAGLNYVDIKCVKTKATVFKIFGHPKIQTRLHITRNCTIESVKNELRKKIDLLEGRSFTLLLETLLPFHSTTSVLEQTRGKSGECWVDLKFTINCFDLNVYENTEIEVNGSDKVICLLRPDTRHAQRILHYDDKHNEHNLDLSQNIAATFVPFTDLNDTFFVFRISQQTILVDDPKGESSEPITIDVWPSDKVGNLLSRFSQERHNMDEEDNYFYFNNERLESKSLFFDILNFHSIPIVHMTKTIEIRFCDQSSEVHSVDLDSCAFVLELRKRIAENYGCAEEEVLLRYGGYQLDCDEARLYQFNIRDKSLVLVHFARFCLLLCKNRKRLTLGYHQDLNFSQVFSKACNLYEENLPANTVFICNKCGRRLSNAQSEQFLPADCCRPHHRNLELVVHQEIIVRFLSKQDSSVYPVAVRTDHTLAFAIDKFWLVYTLSEKEKVRFLNDDENGVRSDFSKTLYEILQDPLKGVCVPFERKMTIVLEVKHRKFMWPIWPSDFLSAVMEEVKEMIQDLTGRTVISWFFKGRQISQPQNRNSFEELRFRQFGIQELDKMDLKSSKLI